MNTHPNDIHRAEETMIQLMVFLLSRTPDGMERIQRALESLMRAGETILEGTDGDDSDELVFVAPALLSSYKH